MAAAGTLPVSHITDHCRLRLIHLTDPHLTSLDARHPDAGAGKRWLSWLSWQIRRRQRHRRSRLNALVRQLQPEAPDAWAVTGDLCQTGLAAEVRQAREWLDRLAPPDRALLVPGNHDIFARDSGPAVIDHWADYLHIDPADPAWPAVATFGPVTLIGVNSAVPTPVFRATGRVGAQMRERLAWTLEAYRRTCRIVLIHHPPLPAACHPRKALEDAAEVSQILSRHGAAAVLHGHLHRNRENRLEIGGGGEITVLCTASASAAGKQGAAAARLFDVAPADGGFRVAMRLIALDASDRAHMIERRDWTTAG